MIISKLKSLPSKPGVYLWKDKHNSIIYIGKAKNLKIRMNQYFKTKGMANSFKTYKLIENIDDFEYIITNNEKEALILEKNLIDKFYPKYNILLKDDKRYPYIKIYFYKNKLAISLIYRINHKKNNEFYYGPFPNGFGARRMLNLLLRIFVYKNGLPNTNDDAQFWQEQFQKAKLFLSYGYKKMIYVLQKKMNLATKKMQFEISHDIKETIKSLEFYKDKQVIQFISHKNIDVIGIYQVKNHMSICMMFYRNGILLSQKSFILEINLSFTDTLTQFYNRYYENNVLPDFVLTNQKIILNSLDIKVPQKGQLLKIVKMAIINASDNIKIKLEEYKHKKDLTINANKKLASLLNIKKLNHILMVDNSNVNNTHVVSVFVSYHNGIKQKKEYRKYNIEMNHKMFDIEYMKQGLIKYFQNKNNVFPDLLILDGGTAHVNMARKLFQQMQISINVIGLVKNNLHKTSYLLDLNNQKIKNIDNQLFNYLKGIQIEVDRFAKVHYAKRHKRTLYGSLQNVKSIGPVSEKKLLKYFHTYNKIYNASIEELNKIVSLTQAKAIKKYFEYNLTKN